MRDFDLLNGWYHANRYDYRRLIALGARHISVWPFTVL